MLGTAIYAHCDGTGRSKSVFFIVAATVVPALIIDLLRDEFNS